MVIEYKNKRVDLIGFKNLSGLFFAFFVFFNGANAQISISYSKSEVIVHSTNNKNINGPGVVKIYRSFLWQNEIDAHQSIIGQSKSTRNSTSFKPIVPFSYNQGYTVIDQNGLFHYFTLKSNVLEKQFSVEGIYPKSTTVPANILKYNIEFSEPVSLSNIYQNIYWTDDAGNKMERMILDLQTPLLNDDGTILTLWIEPGRIKRDLGPNIELGIPFLFGKKYTLHISTDVKNKQGLALHREVTKDYVVGEVDRKSPIVEDWKLSAPKANTKQPLKITFDDLMDYKTVISYIQIKNKKGDYIPVNLKFMDTYLEMTPIDGVWLKGDYTIEIDHKIEDVASNGLNRLFDEDMSDLSQKTGNKEIYTILWSVF